MNPKFFDRTRFDHIGVVTEEKHGEENFVDSTRVWVTNPSQHPANVEYLRYESDTPVTGPIRHQPHVAYRVDSVDEAIKIYTTRAIYTFYDYRLWHKDLIFFDEMEFETVEAAKKLLNKKLIKNLSFQ